MPATDTATHATAPREELLRAAAGLSARISAAQPEIDDQRRLPEALAHDMADLGFFRMLTPRALGGLELDPWAATEVVEALARIDGSAGWCAMIGSQSAWFTAFIPPEAATRIAGRPSARLAGALKPGGKATRTESGYTVSGRWTLASGSTYAEWLYGSCLVDQPANGAGPELRVAYFPAADAEVLDTWHTTGLRGTGSNDFTVREATVPREHTFSFPVLPAAYHDGPLYRERIQNLVFVTQAGQALGVAMAALDTFAELAAGKVRWATTAPLRDQPSVQRDVALAEARIDSARAWLKETTAEVWDTILRGDTPSGEQRRRLRLAITHAIQAAIDTARILHAAAGASAIYSGHPLHRQLQDLDAAAAHVQASPAIFELAGALRLGAPVTPLPGLI